MKNQNTQKTMGIVLVVLFISLAQLASAQNLGKSKLIAGFGASYSTRSFSISSNIDGLNNMKENQEGWESFFMIGGNGVRLRTGFGAFKNSATAANSIKQTALSGMANIYALDLIGKGKKTVHPYVISGAGVSIYEFSGANIPAMPLIFSNPAAVCNCQVVQSTNSGLPAPPPNPDLQTGTTDLAAQTTEPAAANAAKLTTAQVITGLGLETSFRKNGHFFSLFGEMRYGMAVGSKVQNPGMNNTKIKNNSAVTFGIAFGLTNDHKNKGFKSGIH